MSQIIQPIVILCLAVAVHCQLLIDSLLQEMFGNNPDYGVLIPEMIRSRGFGYELHHIYVPDGFVLAVHRIINPGCNQTRSAILMSHGVLGSSNNFLNNEQSGYVEEPLDVVGGNLGFELAKRGHDVWMLDQRGTIFSSNHTRYTIGEDGFWNWSLDEITLYDLPSTIDYITRHTKRSHIGYVGYSQGSMTMFMLMSRIRKYNHIIRPFISLGPVFFLSDIILVRAPQIRNLPYRELGSFLANSKGPLVGQGITFSFKENCRSKVTQETVCNPIFYLVQTFLSPLIIPILPNVNHDRIPVYASASEFFTLSQKQVGHYLQNMFNNIPQQLDVSPEENMRLYGQPMPPVYDPTNITCDSMIFFSAVNDVLSDPKDLRQLTDILKVKPVKHFMIHEPAFGHATFIFGERSMIVPYVVNPILDIMAAFYPGQHRNRTSRLV